MTAESAADARPDGVEPDQDRTVGWAVFDTALGWCGIAWGADGITGTSLPGSGADAARENLRLRHPAATDLEPPAVIAGAIGRIRSLLAGGTDDLADLRLDLTGIGEFQRAAYRIARSVRPGHTITYGAIAAQLGGPGVARAVGRAMGDNPFPIIVPCHRVTGADRSIGGFSAPGGARTKHRMLMMEAAGDQERPGLFGAAELFG